MFRIVSIAGFIVAFAGVVLHFAVCRPKFDDLFGAERGLRILDGLRLLVYLLTLLFIPQKLNLVGIFRKLVFLLALFCFVVLAVTGFYPSVVLGKALSGYLLMVHATFAPVFAICIAILAVMWAHNCRFDKKYWPWLQRLLGRETGGAAAIEKYELGRKVLFWVIIILALPVILSAVLSMFPLFGTHGLELLLQLHRYSTLTLTLVVIVKTYLMVMAQMKE